MRRENLSKKYNELLCTNKYVLNRHETPVLDHPIKIIYVDNDLVVLDKPCSLPVSKYQQKKNPRVFFCEIKIKNPLKINKIQSGAKIE